MLATKAMMPNIANVKMGIPLMKRSFGGTQLKITLPAMYSQRRKLYMLNVRKTAFIFFKFLKHFLYWKFRHYYINSDNIRIKFSFTLF